MSAPILLFSGDYRFLSNFYPVEVEYEGLKYPSVEHAYQAAKTDDLGRRAEIAKLHRAVDAKKAGRGLPLRANWEAVKVRVMAYLLLQKFGPDSALALRLLATGDAELVEGNWWGDKFWGVCEGEGQNVLGNLLIYRRTALREGR